VKENLLFKCFVLGVIAIMFGFALIVIGMIVGDRKGYRDQVVDEVAQGVAKEQTLLGPMLIVPCATSFTREGKVTTTRTEKVLLPESLTVSTTVGVETRKRGIHRVQVYRSTERLTAVFEVPAEFGLGGDARVPDGPAHWSFGVSDARGLHRPPTLRVNGVAAEVKPGSAVEWVPQGFSADAESMRAGEPRRVVLEAEVQLLGTNRLAVVPVGKMSHIEMSGDWPHPSFTGSFLPDERRIDAHGFHAVWELSRFAADIEDAIANWKSQNRTENQRAHAFDVGAIFIEPVDVYQKSERATKYGMLFVILTFVAFFMFEVLKSLHVHPIQYALVAAGLALFFLLLLSLAEHLPFLVAYALAAGSCIGLLTYYVASVLGGWPRALGFGGLLASLYALLYVILESQDYALLLGTLLLFAVLAVILVTTRRVDWYRVTETPRA
jgi:inner membrane protein